jgi:hypothetical protein
MSSKITQKGSCFNYLYFGSFVSIWFEFFETGSCYAAQADLELKVLLPQPSKCLD